MSGFSSVLGHEGAKRHLMRALSEKKVSHAYLLEGPSGVGKKTLSKAFIQALLCENPVIGSGRFDSCGCCRSCELLSHGNHPDVKTIRPAEDGKNISVDQIRDELVSDMQILPYMDSYKVYTIEQADMLNIPAQNAMLKTIEEPPAYGVILLLCENESSLLPTILSRCVKVSLSPLPGSLVKKALIEEGISMHDAETAAAFAQGSLGEALTLAKDEAFTSLREELFSFLAAIPSMTPLEVMNHGKWFEDSKSSRSAIFSLMNLWYRDISVYKETKDPSLLLLKDRQEDIASLADHYTSESILRICDTVRDTYKKLQANVNAALAIDCLLITMKRSV